MRFLASCDVITAVLPENASEKNFCALNRVARNIMYKSIVRLKQFPSQTTVIFKLQFIKC